VSDQDRSRLDSRIELGDPEVLLREIVQTTAVDLVVLATQGRTQLAELFLRSVAKRIVALPSTALPEHRRPHPEERELQDVPGENHSEQRSDDASKNA
jgi:hypothetical protein